MIGGRDRDRTCDFCRVKGARAPHAPKRHLASPHKLAAQRLLLTEATQCCMRHSEAPFLANLWQPASKRGGLEPLELVDTSGLQQVKPREEQQLLRMAKRRLAILRARAIQACWARTRIADRALDYGDGEQVEMELHVKGLDRYQAAVADVDPAWSSGVWWFTPKSAGSPTATASFGRRGRRSPSGRCGPEGVVRDSPPGVRAPDRPSHLLGPSGYPLDRRVHDAGNDRYHQVVLLIAGAVA